MAFEHPSGLPATYDRSSAEQKAARLLFPEGVFLQGGNLNELQSIEARRNQRVARMVAKDGDRVEGADIVLSADGTVQLASGRIYIGGDVRPVAAATLEDVPMTGEVSVGVKLRKTLVTHEDDPSLLGLHPGSWAEGEPGASREDEEVSWALADDDQEGDFFAVYLILDGTVIDQTPPAALTGIFSAIALYDRDAHGHYIVEGCEVTALGKVANEQIFAIQAGTANIMGWKRVRKEALRFAQIEDADLETVAAEPSTFTGTTGGTTVVSVLRPPIAAVQAAIVVKRVTEVVVRGPVPGGTDALAHSSVVAIESITQSSTTFANTAYALANGEVSWAPAGAEPAAASTYSVTYLYNDAVTPDAVTDTTVSVSGGVNGQPVLLSYTSKLPRVDLLGLDINGLPVYVKGLSARRGARAPIAPSTILSLAEIHNSWLVKPTVVNNGTHNVTYEKLARYLNRLIDMLEQFDRSELERDILAREPVSKNGIFTDAFADDFYRDQGAPQTAAINRGVLQLAIDPVMIQAAGSTIVTLDYDEEIVVRQDLATSGMKINPYASFVQMPAGMTLAPAVDFWTEQETEWTSPETRQFTTAPGVPPGTTVINDTVSERQEVAEFLRQIQVAVTIEGFGVGENLESLTFDGVNVTPAGTQTANGQGVLTVNITVPPLVPVGARRVRAEGMAGSFAEATYVGEGVIDISVMRQVTLISRAAPAPAPVTTTPAVVKVTQPVVRTTTIVFRPTSTSIQRSPLGGDPLAQTFTLPEDRHIIGVNFKFTAIGVRFRGVRVQLAETLNGYPTMDVVAEAFINMQTVQVGDLIEARFKAPVFITSDREYCFVFMTDDPDHAVSIARLGDVDQATQTFVSAQPYTVGVLLASANRATWTPVQDADLYFQIVAASFAPTTKTVTLWSGPLDDISDLMVRASVELPTEQAQFRFEIVRADATVLRLAPEQNHEFAEYVDEVVTLRAVLSGTAKVSSVLYPGTHLIGGRIRTSGTYITRTFPMGTAVRVAAVFAALLPAGSTVAVDVDAANDSWSSLSSAGSGTLGGGWIEPRYQRDPFTAANGRVRLTLTGGPGARPSLARLRAYSL